MKRAVALVLLAALAACSGRAGMVPSAPRTAAGPLAFTIKVPLPGATRTQRVSSATAGVGVTTFAHADAGHATPIGYFGNDVSASSPACTTSGAFRVCSIQAAAPAGDDDLVVKTYDAVPDASGAFPGAHVLDTGTVRLTILQGQNNTAVVTLQGIPSTIAVAIDNPNGAFTGDAYGGMPYNVEVAVKDAAGAQIIGATPYAVPLSIASNAVSARLLINGSVGSSIAAPSDRITLVDDGTSRATSTVTASATGATPGSATYVLDPRGATISYPARTGPGAIASGTAQDLYYGDAAAELVRFDPVNGSVPLSFSGQSPPALAVSGLVENRFAGVDVSFVTRSDGANAWVGNSDGTGAQFDALPQPVASDCSIENGQDGSRYLACGNSVIDDDPPGGVSTFPGKALGGIATGADGRLWVGYAGAGGGGVLAMADASVGTSAATDYPLPPNRYATRIVACPDGALYFLEGTTSGGSWSLGKIATTGSLDAHALTGVPTALVCGPDASVWIGDGDGTIYRYDLGANAESLVSSNGGSIGGLALGPDGAVWGTDTPLDLVLRVTP